MENILLTGASGFLGNNIKPLLSRVYNIKTLGLNNSDDFKINLAKDIPEFNERYEVVIHAAGKAHSNSKSLAENKLFFEVNLQGTKNICTALEKSGVPRSMIFVSTTAVYGLDFGESITENQPLRGETPYALSKILAEEFLTWWCNKCGVILSIIRPSLIAGPNPPGNLGSMINGIKSGKYLSVSGGKARKSVLMVHDIANLVFLLAEKGGTYNVCDSYQPSFRDLEKLIVEQLGKSSPINIPYGFAKVLAFIGDCLGNKAPINSQKLDKISKSLTFSNEKARRELGWEPLNVLENFKIL